MPTHLPDYDALETAHPARTESDPPGTVRYVIANYPQIIGFAAAAFLLIRFGDFVARALLLFAFAILLAIVLNAPVRKLEKIGIKRALSVTAVALILLTSVGVSLYTAGPRLAEQAISFVQNAPEGARKLRAQIAERTKDHPAVANYLNRKDSMAAPDKIAGEAQRLLPSVGRFALRFVGSVAEGFFVFVTMIYLVAAPKPVIRGVLSAVPPQHRKAATHSLARIVGHLEAWAVATLLLMAVVGVAVFFGLLFLHVHNAFLFGVLAAFGEAIPTVGPVLSAVPPTLVALADDPHKALLVLGLFLIVQQSESHILVPIIMSRNLNLHPVSILFFVLALGSTLGVAGALLAVPVTIVVKVLYEEFYLKGRAPGEAAIDAAAETVMRAGERERRGQIRTVQTPPPTEAGAAEDAVGG